MKKTNKQAKKSNLISVVKNTAIVAVTSIAIVNTMLISATKIARAKNPSISIPTAPKFVLSKMVQSIENIGKNNIEETASSESNSENAVATTGNSTERSTTSAISSSLLSKVSKSNVIRRASSNTESTAYLSSIKIDGNELTGFSAPEIKQIGINARNYIGSVLTAESTEADATIDNVTINGTSFAIESGKYDYDATLSYNSEDMVTISADKKNDNQKIDGLGSFILDKNNKYDAKIKVTSAGGSATNTYNFNITKESSNKLKSLSIAGVTISPEFNADTTEYSAQILSSVTSLDVSATPYDRNSKVTILGNDNLVSGTNTITVTVSNPNVENDLVYTISVESKSSITDTYSYSGNYKEVNIPFSGTYKFELWGASGGYSRKNGSIGPAGGKGGYTVGNISLNKSNKLYAYVGGHGTDAVVGKNSSAGWNGGGLGTWDYSDNETAGAGGGATDIRLTNGNWNDFNSLKSRIMVAAGGGGSCWTTAGGAGGGLNGIAGPRSTAATQTSGYAFGIGQSGSGAGSDDNGVPGAGGGYYGGYTDKNGSDDGSSAGGSSFISGYDGCDAISEESTSDNIIHTGQSIHYSGLKFTDAKTIAGNSSMPTYTGTSTMTGNSGNGYAKVTILSQNQVVFPVKDIKTSVGIFNVPFTPDNNTYYVELDSEESYVDVSVELADTNASIEEGSEKTILTNVGTTEHTVKVTGSDGEVYEYKLIFIRKKSSYPYLKELNIDGTKIDGFEPEKLNYSVTMPYYTGKVTLDALKARGDQVIEGLGDYEIDYNEKIIKIKVTSEDETKTATYAISIKREETTKLKSCEIEGQNFSSVFDKDTLNYDFEVTSGVINLNITAIPYDDDAKVSIKGAGYIKEGKNTVTITVSKEGLADTVYTIIVTKPESIYGQEYEYNYTGSVQTFVAPYKGYYQFELWGASGGYSRKNGSIGPAGGKGGYTSGKIVLNKGDTLYIYVGGHGTDAIVRKDSTAGWNGGGLGTWDYSDDEACGAGGGATDIRIVNGNWNDFNSLKSRIMVAAGGGGSCWTTAGGSGGGINGIAGPKSTAATQKSGYAFGIGQSGVGTGSHQNGVPGAGGGYYGGYTDKNGSNDGSSAGGSSFISGYDGCDAISEESTSDNIIHTGQSIHYSGMKFTKAEMVAGNQTMPTHDGEDVMTGNSGNGYAKITLLKDPSQNNLLKELQISYDETKHTMPVGTQDILDKAFSYDDNEYTVKVGPEDTSFTIYGVQDDATATVEGNGTYDIPAGTTPITLTVTAESGDVRTYTINVVREASSNATPINIQIDGLIESMLSFKPDVYGVLTNTATGEKTEFNPEVYDYTMVVPARIKELTFNVTKGHAYQVVENDGLHKLDAEDGKNTIAINIKSEDGSTTKTYTYHINRDMDSNCLLKSLNVTNLTPEDWPGVITEKQDIDFDQNTLEYYLIVPNEVTKLDVNAVAEDEQVTPIIKGADSLKVGLNNIYVIVNARNGEQLVYIIHCYRTMSGNTFLSDLNVKSVDGATQYTLEPTFNKILDTYEVTEIVPNDTTQVVINATPEVNTTTVSGTGTVDLKTGVNVFKIETKAEDGSIGTYNLSIERAKSANNYLSALSAKEGKFIDQMQTDEDGNPKEKAFYKETLEYNIEVGADVNYLTLAYTKEDETATVEITGNSGFKAGDNIVTITVTAENGDKREYKITVNKAQSTNCYLSSLSTSSGELSPEFNKETDSYTVEVENETQDITVNATTEDVRSTLAGTGKYALAVGENSVDIVVTAENGDTKTYTLKIIRKLNSNKNLLNVEGTYKITTEENGEIVSQENKTVKAAKSADGLTFTIDVPNEISKINITGTPEVAKTTVTGNGKKEITVGENKFTLTLTAEDGGAKDYTVIVNRAKSNNCNLKYLFVNESNYSPKLTADQTTYATTVLAGTTSLTMKIETEDEGATYVVSGNENFTEGENDVKITVTASDGVTQKVYTIKAFVQSNNTESNYLSSLVLDPGTLNPVFDKDTSVYNVELPYETTKTTVSAIAESSLATIEGTGDYDLQVGENDIAVVVTSGDGIKRTYQVKVTRKQSTEARLSKLEIANHTFTPEFDKDTTTYYIDTTLDQLSISAETLSKNASYEIIGNENFVKGTNNVIVRVTAPDGVTTKDYTLVVTKTASPNYYLSDLKVVGYSLSPEFNKQTSSYTVNVPSNVYKVEVRATPEDQMATVEGTGIVSLNPGKNVQNVTVTSESGKVKTYTITINKGLSDDNYLKELSVSKGTLTPEFNKDTLEYNVSLDYEDSTEDIIAYANDYRSTISGDGNKELKVGDNKFNVVVTAEDGTTRTYTINVTRKPAISALLENLAVTNYSINPTFVSNTKDYSVTVDNEIATVKDLGLKIETLDPKATYKLKYNDSEISINDETELIVGINTLTIEVTSSDGVTKENYTLNVKRQIESNNYLVYIQPSVGTLTPVFNKKTMNYTMTVDSNVEKITFSAEPEAQDSTVEGITDDSGNKVEYSLNKGENEIPITVTSSLGIKRTYKIVVTRKKNSNNYLSTLKVKKGSNEMEISPIFDKNTQEYTVDGIPVGTSVIQILGTTEDELATISGSGYISLSSATTKQNIVVTAEDGTQRTYTLTLNREKSSEANLTDLVPSVGTLNPTFVYGTTEYSLELGNTDNYLSFDAETLDKNATVTGAESEAVPNGTSKRIITVTAEDGTQITYTVNVNRVRTDDASLKELTLADGWSLTPEFSESNYNYTIEVPNSVTKFESSNVTSAVPKYDTSTVTIDGDMELSTKHTNVFNIKVLAADGFTTQTYKINITRAKSDNSNVTNIVPKIVGIDSNGNREEARTETLNPTFDKDVSQYTLTVGNEDYYISFDVTTEDENAVITGAEEQSIEDGTNKYTITITSEDGTTTQTYTINVIKNRTNYAKLKSLAVKNYTLDQEFDPEVTEYTLTVPNDKFEITENEIVAKAMYDGSTIEYNGTVELSTIELNTYEVKVTSPDGTASRTYTLKITRKKSSDSTLKSLSATGYKFDKTFASGTTDYICYVPKGTETFETSKVTAVPTDKYATIEMSGDLDRTKGENTFKINVTSQDETTQTTYTLKVEDEKSNDGDLKSLSVTGGTMSPEFDKLTRTYTVNMTNKQKELTIQAEPEDSSAVILEGTGTFEITDAETEHMIIIEAEDGSKTIYILNITKDMTPLTMISGKITTDNIAGKHTATVYMYKAGTDELVDKVQTKDDGTYSFDIQNEVESKMDIVVQKPGYLDYKVLNVPVKPHTTTTIGDYKMIAGNVVKTTDVTYGVNMSDTTKVNNLIKAYGVQTADDLKKVQEINVDDLTLIKSHYGTITSQNKATNSIFDFNEDGVVNDEDTKILKKNYGLFEKIVDYPDL